MKIVGIGLNKTGTKTLRHYLMGMGCKHKTYDIEAFENLQNGELEKVFAEMDDYDSFEDWPWPLIYKEIDEYFDDALFILTKRKNPETWYKSLCKMAVRRGPFKNFEKYIYGYAMPQGRKKEHIAFYNNHNHEVREYFKDRPHKLLEITWGEGSEGERIAKFIGKPNVVLKSAHINKSAKVYSGDNLFIAQLNRILYQSARYISRKLWK